MGEHPRTIWVVWEAMSALPVGWAKAPSANNFMHILDLNSSFRGNSFCGFIEE